MRRHTQGKRIIRQRRRAGVGNGKRQERTAKPGASMVEAPSRNQALVLENGTPSPKVRRGAADGGRHGRISARAVTGSWIVRMTSFFAARSAITSDPHLNFIAR